MSVESERCHWHAFTKHFIQFGYLYVQEKFSYNISAKFTTCRYAHKFVLSFVPMLMNLYCFKLKSVCLQLAICIQSIQTVSPFSFTHLRSLAHTLSCRAYASKSNMCNFQNQLKHVKLLLYILRQHVIMFQTFVSSAYAYTGFV